MVAVVVVVVVRHHKLLRNPISEQIQASSSSVPAPSILPYLLPRPPFPPPRRIASSTPNSSRRSCAIFNPFLNRMNAN
ncbi:hypothetical protein E2C01_091843 [Portunus trituberculatus]|uniref:Uncharacterized protein n=1 Tax=Portunus trituberculatus TaxID=210409 RepID=A0A5B7JTY7_PORTR|nr:hypothetical protein [Portunus trituberculatus]